MKESRIGAWSCVVITVALLPGGVAAFSPRAAGGGKPPPQELPQDRLRVADSARLEVAAHWGPITESEYSFHRRWDELRTLRPARERATYSGADFQALLPSQPAAPGELWEVSDDALLKFLRQLHAGVRFKLHINNGDSRGGGYGCVRACDNRWADVMLRVHAEFALKEGVFTPGQFAGRLVLDRSSGRVVYFRLLLPPSPVNVDIGWRQVAEFKVGDRVVKAEPTWIADAGSVSRLELVGGDDGVLRTVERVPGQSVEQVNASFARRLYRFAAIDWVPFDQAVAAATRAGKPLHVIAINGTLDDESC